METLLLVQDFYIFIFNTTEHTRTLLRSDRLTYDCVSVYSKEFEFQCVSMVTL